MAGSSVMARVSVLAAFSCDGFRIRTECGFIESAALSPYVYFLFFGSVFLCMARSTRLIGL